MRKFYTPVDKRSRNAMTEYLKGHFRYSTMNSWNRSTSYACNMKLTNLGVGEDITHKLFDMIHADGFFDPLQDLMRDFAETHNYKWQAGMNGRSGGYLVLYQGDKEASGYKSYCTSCGQPNYKAIAESGLHCGACGKPSRTDYIVPPVRTLCYPGRSTDMFEDFEDWSMRQLCDRVDLVQSFNHLADAMVAEALYMAEHFDVSEETFFVEQKRAVIMPGA